MCCESSNDKKPLPGEREVLWRGVLRFTWVLRDKHFPVSQWRGQTALWEEKEACANALKWERAQSLWGVPHCYLLLLSWIGVQAWLEGDWGWGDMQEACDEKILCPSLEASRCWLLSTNIRHWPGSWGRSDKWDRQVSVEGCKELTILSHVFNGCLGAVWNKEQELKHTG